MPNQLLRVSQPTLQLGYGMQQALHLLCLLLCMLSLESTPILCIGVCQTPKCTKFIGHPQHRGKSLLESERFHAQEAISPMCLFETCPWSFLFLRSISEMEIPYSRLAESTFDHQQTRCNCCWNVCFWVYKSIRLYLHVTPATTT